MRNGEGLQRVRKRERGEYLASTCSQHSKPFDAFKKIILFQFLKVSYTRFEVEFIINRALRLSVQENLFKGSLLYPLCTLTSTLSSTHFTDILKMLNDILYIAYIVNFIFLYSALDLKFISTAFNFLKYFLFK